MHVGHDASDGGLTRKEICEQFRETIEKSVKKFKPHRVAACKITPVKNVFFLAEIKTTLKYLFQGRSGQKLIV